MISRLSLMATCLLARTVSASLALADDMILVRADDVLNTPYSSLVSAKDTMADSILLRQQQQKQQQIQAVADAPIQPDGSLNLTAWDQDTNQACVDRLRPIQRPSNPSGDSICYNLPSLDTRSGVFEAELRLYKVAEPRGIWVGVNQSSIKVSVSYTGAVASPVKPEELAAGGGGGGGGTGTASKIKTRADSDPQLLQTYMLVGQINGDQMSENMSMATLQSLVMPTLTLTATNASGAQIATNVSLNEACFVRGVFSREVVQSDFAAAQAAVDDALAALRNGTAAFVLPGVQILIFPIGLVITSIWLAIGLAAYGIGTFERIQYAELYQSHKTISSGSGRRGKPI